MSSLTETEQNEFNQWLVTNLEPISNANPVTLAKYVVALLMEKPDKATCISQFSEFLLDDTKPFVEKLFNVLKTKKFSNSTQPSSQPRENLRVEEPSEIKRRRSVDRSDDHDVKRRKFSSRNYQTSRRERSRERDNYNDSRNRNTRERSRERELFDTRRKWGKRNENSSFQPRNSRKNENFDHGSSGGSSSGGSGGGGGSGSSSGNGSGNSYGKFRTNFRNNNNNNNSRNQRGNNRRGYVKKNFYDKKNDFNRGGGEEGYNPEKPLLGTQRDYNKKKDNMKNDKNNSVPLSRPRTLSNTVLVTNIPPNLNTIEKLNNHFKQFGKVVNLNIKQHNNKCFVKYGSVKEAKKAWESPQAVLGNRFIKVLWTKPLIKETTENHHMLIKRPIAKSQKLKKFTSRNKDVISQQLQLYKEMMEKVAHVTDQHEKKDLLENIKSLSHQLGFLLDTQKKAVSEIKRKENRIEESKNKHITTTTPGTTNSNPTTTAAATTAAANTTTDGIKQDGLKIVDKSNTDQPKVVQPILSRSFSYSFRGRGRGRGRGLGRGRGRGRGRGSSWFVSRMRIDNRTSSFVINNLTSSETSEKSLRDHFSQHGSITKIDLTGKSPIVTFDTRQSAEKAIIKGGKMGDKKFQINWNNIGKINQTMNKIKGEKNASKNEVEEQVPTIHCDLNRDDDDEDDHADNDLSWKRR